MSAPRALCFSLLAWCCGATAAGDCTAVESSVLPEQAKALMQAFAKARLTQPVLAEEAILSDDASQPQQEQQQTSAFATIEAPQVIDLQPEQIQAAPAQAATVSVPFLLKDTSISTPNAAAAPQVADKEPPLANEGMTGELATLDEQGFQVVKQLNSEADLAHFIRKLITEREGSVCDETTLKKMVQFYNSPDNGNDFQMLEEDINRAANSSCPWVGTVQNEWCSPTRTLGATASIDEPGYANVKKENCFAITRHWLQRAAEHNSYHICSDGALSGMTMYYYKANSPANYAWMQKELATAAAKDCPWVVRHGHDCPELDENAQCTGRTVPAQAVPAKAPQLVSGAPGTPTQVEQVTASTDAVAATAAAPDIATGASADTTVDVAPIVDSGVPMDAATVATSEFAIGMDDTAPDAPTGAATGAAAGAAPSGASEFAIGIDAAASGAALEAAPGAAADAVAGGASGFAADMADMPAGSAEDAAVGGASEFAIGMENTDGSAVDADADAASGSGYMDDSYGSAINDAADTASSSATEESTSGTASQSVASAGKTVVHTYDGDSSSSSADLADSSASEDDEFTVKTSSSSAGTAKKEVASSKTEDKTSEGITYEDDFAVEARSRDEDDDTSPSKATSNADLDNDDFHVGTIRDSDKDASITSKAAETESTSSTSATSKRKSTSGTAATSTRKGSALAASTSKGTSNSNAASKDKSDTTVSKTNGTSNTSATAKVKSNSSAAAASAANGTSKTSAAAKITSNKIAAAASKANGTSKTSAAAKITSNKIAAAASKANGTSNTSAATKIRSNNTAAAASTANGTSKTSAAAKIRSNSSAAAASTVNGTSNSTAGTKIRSNSTTAAANKITSNAYAASKAKDKSTAAAASKSKSNSSASTASKVTDSNTASTNETKRATSSASDNSKANSSVSAHSNSTRTADSTGKASSGINEATFKVLKKKDDPKKMIDFMGKLINTTGFELCAEGGLNGLVHFYVGDQYPTANFKRLNEEIAIAAQTNKCPWVVKKGEKKCPDFGKCWR